MLIDSFNVKLIFLEMKFEWMKKNFNIKILIQGNCMKFEYDFKLISWEW